MKFSPRTRRQKRWLILLVMALVFFACKKLIPYPELVVEIGETYEVMVERSYVDFDPLIAGEIWYGEVHSPARLRFVDPQYGFTTPASRTFTVSFNANIAHSLQISPQIQPQKFDDALKVALDIQKQWRDGGWTLLEPDDRPAIADTPEGRARLLTALNGTTIFWEAGKRYDAMMTFNRTLNERNPNFKPENQRYRISMQISLQRTPPPKPSNKPVSGAPS